MCRVLPVWAYLAMDTLLGAPLYRYHVAAHGPMLVVIALAAWQLMQTGKGRDDQHFTRDGFLHHPPGSRSSAV